MAPAEIPEEAASGTIGDIYADIRATLGVPMVNTIYRHLAIAPAALEWAWSAVRPHMLSGAVARQADVLRQDVRGALQAARPASPIGPLRVPPRRRRDARRLVHAYDVANCLNLVALTHLLRQADGLPAPDATRYAGMASPAPGDAAPASLPAIPALDSLPPDVQACLQRLNRFGERNPPAAVAGLYRHLAAWPQLLAPVEAWLRPWEQCGALLAAREAAVRSVAGQADRHPLGMPTPRADILARFREPLQRYCHAIIPKMVPVCQLLDDALARPGQHATG